MEITRKCSITGKYGFDLVNSNRFAIIEVEGKYGDTIKVNKVNGIRYSEIWAAYEQPGYEDHPTIFPKEKIIALGGERKESKRTVCVVGR